MSRETSHELGAVGLDQLATRKDTKRLEYVGHDTRYGGLARSGVASKNIMLALERVGLTTLDLQVKEGCEVGHLLLHALQTHHPLKLLQALSVIHLLRCLVGDIGLDNSHQLLVAHLLHVAVLQASGLILTNLVEQRAHRSAVGKVLVALLVHLLDHLLGQGFCLRRKHVFLRLCKNFHDLEELIRRVVIDVEEVVKAATHTGIDAKEIVHLGAVSGGDDHELAAIVLHTLHKRLKGLCTLVIALAALAQRCQGIGLVDKEDTTHGLITETVHHLWCLALIGTDHLRAVYLDHMTGVEIADGSQNLAKLACDSGLAGARITSQHDVHRHLLLLTKAALGTLHAVLHGKGNLPDGLLHLIHADKAIKVVENIVE